MTTLHFAHALLPDGWHDDVAVEIRDGLITALRTGMAPAHGAAASGIAIPGLASLHSHTFQRGMAGLAETRGPQSDSFWSWRQVMYRFLGALDADDVEAIAAFAFMEMLEGGFTSVGEFHYLHHGRDGEPYANLAEHSERIAAASAETGIGLTLLPVFYAQGGFGGQAPTEGQRRFLNDPDRFARLVEGARGACAYVKGARVGIAPHSLRAVTPDSLKAVLAAHRGGPIHIHISEQMKEVEDCLAWSGRRPVEWLLDNAAVNEDWCLIHATHMTPDEARAVAHRGAVAGLCPITEANLGDGIFPAPDFVGSGGRYGVGTDSNVEITAAGELKMLEYSQRLGLRARNVLAMQEGMSTGGALYRAALAGGAQALARNEGRLAVGASADIVVLDDSHPALAAMRGDQRLDGYIFGSGQRMVEAVYARGVRVVEAGRHIAHDAVAARFARVLARVVAT